MRRLRGMKITFLPHARERMTELGISAVEVVETLAFPHERGAANFGRLYAQMQVGHRRIRVIYNQGADEAMVVSVMLRRREGGA